MANLTDGDQSFCSAGGGPVATAPTTSTPTSASGVAIGGATSTTGPTSAGQTTTTAPSGTTAGSGGVWAEFCERHARAASADFARSCVHYVTNNLPESARQTVSHRDFMRRFIECFQEHFEHDFYRRRMQSKVSVGRVACQLA